MKQDRIKRNSELNLSNHFLCLPKDILLQIFSCLPLNEIYKLPQVCKTINDIISQFFITFNYSDKAFFAKWLAQELKKTEIEEKNFNRKQLT